MIQVRRCIHIIFFIDVNECDTQLVVCDPNAECVNHFGSYSCQCGTGFQDESRSGAGTVCVDMKKTGKKKNQTYIYFYNPLSQVC